VARGRLHLLDLDLFPGIGRRLDQGTCIQGEATGNENTVQQGRHDDAANTAGFLKIGAHANEK